MISSDLTVRELMKHAVTPHVKKTASLIADVHAGGVKISHKNEERVHDLRTQTRRLDIALDLFDGWLPDSRTDWLRKQLKKIRKKAGAVRNIDVLMPLLKQVAKPLPKSARKWLLKRARSARADACNSLRRACRRVTDRHFKRRGLSLKRHFGWKKRSAAPSVKEFSLREIHRHAKSFFARIEQAKDDPAILHPARIAGRKLRYALELLDNTLAESLVHATCDRLSEVQDTLGKANDQGFALSFLNDSEAKCRHKSIASALPRAIHSLDDTTQKQLKLAIHEVARIAERVQKLLDELTSQT